MLTSRPLDCLLKILEAVWGMALRAWAALLSYKVRCYKGLASFKFGSKSLLLRPGAVSAGMGLSCAISPHLGSRKLLIIPIFGLLKNNCRTGPELGPACRPSAAFRSPEKALPGPWRNSRRQRYKHFRDHFKPRATSAIEDPVSSRWTAGIFTSRGERSSKQ